MASSVNSNAVLCVKGEIHNVLTVLRLNSRWASRERFTKEVPLEAESPLARAFKGLHSYLEEVDDLANVDTVRYLLPFLAVVESPATTGPMTGVALSSLHKFLLYGFIRKDCPRVEEGIALVAQAISRCRFEETDPESDEVVLMKLLELSAQCLRCEVGDLLEDASCWNIFHTCYTLYQMATDERASRLRRDTAGNTLANVVLMLFSRPRVARANVKSSSSGTVDVGLSQGSPGSSHDASSPASPPRNAGQASRTSNEMAAHSGSDRSASGGEGADGRGSPVWRPALAGDGGNAEGFGNGARSAVLESARLLQDDLDVEPWPSVDGVAEPSRAIDGVEVGDSPQPGQVDVGIDGGEGRDQQEARDVRDDERSGATVETFVDSRVGSMGVHGGHAGGGDDDAKDGESDGVLVKVMRFLSRLSDPRSNSARECVLGLRLINVALEAGGADLGRIPALVRVMRGDLCKHLLQNSQTADLNVLSLTLRVVFNLFNSIKDHLKVQLEVFLTSVHLRVLDGANNGAEQQELALESLLEFTREPALMVDVYINYDCDVQCTNLFETICHALSSHALPRGGMEVNALNRLALEGVLAVIESISRRCQASPPQRSSHAPQVNGSPSFDSMSHSDLRPRAPTPSLPSGERPDSHGPNAGQDSSGFLENASTSETDSDIDSLGNASGHGFLRTDGFGGHGGPATGANSSATRAGAFGEGGVMMKGDRVSVGSDGDGVGVRNELGWLQKARARTAEVLQERKKMKRKLGLAAERFNSGSKGWLEYAQELGLIPRPASAAATARFLKSTVMLDRSRLGEYLSRGPADKYPFNAQVLEEYVKLFDMRDMDFVEALRAFLKEFRLPGEAQCIDRLMEAFAGQQYEQGLGSGRHPFVNADAAFTMAFSAIMLNTDLHNRQIADHRRMSLQDFIRNNRQINGGEDLPREFLEGVYKSIKEDEIQVLQDHVSMAAEGLGIDYTRHWDGILNRAVASASFTPARTARKHLFTAGVHERDMLVSINGPASEAMRAVFLRTRDDLLVLGCLRGFRSHAHACVYLGLPEPFNKDLVFFLKRGLQYISAAAEGAVGPPFPEALQSPGLRHGHVADVSTRAPFASGCVVHRDLLALKCGLELAIAYAYCVSTAWGPLLECVFALADLQALPPSLTDVDDFGDAQGNPLPPSVFARRCRDRARSCQDALLSQGGGARATVSSVASASSAGSAGAGGLWGTLSGVLFSRPGDGSGVRRGESAAEASIGALAEVVRTVQLEHLFSQTKDLPLEVVEGLLSALLSSRDPATPRSPSIPPSNNAAAGGSGSRVNGVGGRASGAEGERSVGLAMANFEAHAVLALELSSRVVQANRHRVPRLWPSLHAFLSRVLGDEGSVTMTRMPFLVERAMVTVLRACIHMLDRQDMEDLLLGSLRLLLALPPDVMLPLSNRLASGLLILIQANASALSGPSTTRHWEVIGALMSKAVVGSGGRGFILEALAFVVKRGLGLLGRHNAFMAHELLCAFAWGRFGEDKPDLAWASPACAALEVMTFTVVEVLKEDESSCLWMSSSADGDANGRCRTSSTTPTAVPTATLPGPTPTSAELVEPGPRVLTASGTTASESPGAPEQQASDGGRLSRDEAERLWLSTLRVLGTLAASSFPRVAKGASESLERLVLEVHGVRPETWGEAFAEVLLRLPVPLLPLNFRVRPDGDHVQGTYNEEVCLRCCTILSRAFLHHLQALASLPSFGRMWLECIRLLSLNLRGVLTGDDGLAGEALGGSEARLGPAGTGNGNGNTRGSVVRGSVAAESCQQIITNMVLVAAHMGLLGGAAADKNMGMKAAGPSDKGRAKGRDGEKEDSGVEQGARSEGAADPRRLLYLTGQILDPVCPGLRPLLLGLSGDSAPSAPNARSSPGDDRGVEVGDVVAATEDANSHRLKEGPVLDHSDGVRESSLGDRCPRTVDYGDKGDVSAQPDATRTSSTGMTEKKAFPQKPPDTHAESSPPDLDGGREKADEAVATTGGAGSWIGKGRGKIEVSVARSPDGPRAVVAEPVRARTAQIV